MIANTEPVITDEMRNPSPIHTPDLYSQKQTMPPPSSSSSPPDKQQQRQQQRKIYVFAENKTQIVVDFGSTMCCVALAAAAVAHNNGVGLCLRHINMETHSRMGEYKPILHLLLFALN